MWLDNLRLMKEKSELTTKEIAKQSGIPEPTLEKLFSGVTKDPKLPTMQKLVRFFGYTLDDLDGELAEKENSSSNAGETALEEENDELLDIMNEVLIRLGLIRDGQDLTRRQSEIIAGICKILLAAFED